MFYPCHSIGLYGAVNGSLLFRICQQQCNDPDIRGRLLVFLSDIDNRGIWGPDTGDAIGACGGDGLRAAVCRDYGDNAGGGRIVYYQRRDAGPDAPPAETEKLVLFRRLRGGI